MIQTCMRNFNFWSLLQIEKKLHQAFYWKNAFSVLFFKLQLFFKLFAKMICVWFRIWIVNSLQLWHICIHKYRFCDVWGSCELYFKESFMVKVLGHLFQQQTFITHFFFIPPRPIMAKSACLYLHVSLSYYLVKCGGFFYADVSVS